MPPIPRYVQRFARIPIALEILNSTRTADGPARPMRLSDLAIAVGSHTGTRVKPAELQEDLLAYYTADTILLPGLRRDEVLEFLGSPDGEGDEDPDPNDAEWVRITSQDSLDELGVEYVDAEEFGMLYMAAQSLLETEPDNADLIAVADVLAQAVHGEAKATPAPGRWAANVQAIRAAIEDRRQVRIVYSRMWREGVTDRIIEPYRLVQTKTGWEVDAGPPDAERHLRTFLASHIRECEVLDDTFTPPARLIDLLAAQRATQTVRVEIPHTARWAADFFGSEVRLVQDDELVTLDVDFLEPVSERVGLLLLAAGEDARVLNPSALLATGPAMARKLLEHHQRAVKEIDT